MKAWELFAEECIKYLQNKYSTIKFILTGKKDSTKSDILVKTINQEFYIEVKSPLSQGKQFVLIRDVSHHFFVYSPKNNTPVFKQT